MKRVVELDLLCVKEHIAKDEESNHHRKGRNIVRIGSRNKPFILIVPIWTNRNLSGNIKIGSSYSIVFDHELVDAKIVWKS